MKFSTNLHCVAASQPSQCSCSPDLESLLKGTGDIFFTARSVLELPQQMKDLLQLLGFDKQHRMSCFPLLAQQGAIRDTGKKKKTSGGESDEGAWKQKEKLREITEERWVRGVVIIKRYLH